MSTVRPDQRGPTVTLRDEIVSRDVSRRRPPGAGSIYHDGTSWIAAIRTRDGKKVKRRARTEAAAKIRLGTLIKEYGKARKLGQLYQPPGTRGLKWIWQAANPKPKGRMGITPRVRFQVLHRDGFRCVYCGATPQESELQVDHVVPIAKGGTDDLSNLATACVLCNRGKSDLELTA